MRLLDISTATDMTPTRAFRCFRPRLTALTKRNRLVLLLNPRPTLETKCQPLSKISVTERIVLSRPRRRQRGVTRRATLVAFLELAPVTLRLSRPSRWMGQRHLSCDLTVKHLCNR